jgi:2'-5' RNA ligase
MRRAFAIFNFWQTQRMADLLEPLILTAAMDHAAFERFDAERREFFPAHRNHLSAHITLFHQLPSDRLEGITVQLEALVARVQPIHVEVIGLRFLGRGVAYDLRSPKLETLRQDLAGSWLERLTNQDRGGFKPHVTVQNKVSASQARETLALLEARFQPWAFEVTGLTLWRYLGGPWERLMNFAFNDRIAN